jgi:hypothetical protein
MTGSVRPTIGEVLIADKPETWSALGFEVEEASFAVGTVALRLTDQSEEEGIVGWSVRDVLSIDLDGLPTRLDRSRPVPPAKHPNGALGIDHLVVLTSSLDRTAAALDDAGVRLRRVRETGTPQAPSRQGFFRLGEVVLEVVQRADAGEAGEGEDPDAGPGDAARFWGLVFVVADLDGLAQQLGDRLGKARDAVQPGRRIATLQRSAGAKVPVAFISPDPGRR